jgi:hypothetical protein
MNLTAILQRDHAASDLVTFGKLYLPWLKVQPDIYTIELPWKDNEPDVSCIPAGTYTLSPYSSPKHGDVWEYQNVLNRSLCLMHPANYACEVRIGEIIHPNELEGCTAPGFGIDESIPMITRSQDAMNYLRTTIGVKTTWQLEVRD